MSDSFQLFLDPWDVQYGAEFAFDAAAAPAVVDQAVLDVETTDWRPIDPVGRDHPSNIYFLDGVRRLEARILARRDGVTCQGVFGTCAVGSVSVRPTPTIEHDTVHRVVALNAGQLLPSPVTVSPQLVYHPATSESTDPDGAILAVQQVMREAEEALARRLADSGENALVVVDGPLTSQTPLKGAAIGFIKRLHQLYLPPDELRVLAALRTGQRTPLFALRASVRFSRYAWFQRLAPAGPADFDLAGIARLEVADAVGRDRAVHLADLAAAVLPQYVPGRERDPRSPQNLLPIGALESLLRRRMGDPRLVRRHIEAYLIGQNQRPSGRSISGVSLHGN
ncbi:MAG: hypothetical protein FJX76_15465 [Armatimonadetes bacterium]|nr:hypothetical protein [Armatimonadota bacterium]